MSAEEQKRQAAMRAVEMVEPGMRLGLGTGSILGVSDTPRQLHLSLDGLI